MERLSVSLRWFFLISTSLIIVFLLQYLGAPAALLLGPMFVGVMMGMSNTVLHIDHRLFMLAQAILGCMIGQNLSPTVFSSIAAHWPVILAVLLMSFAASALCGFLLVRFSQLPGSTGAWGVSAGAASVMVAMADEHGADARLVAFIQYLRVLFVVIVMVIVSRYLLDSRESSTALRIWFPPLNHAFITTFFVVFGGLWLVQHLRIPSGAILLPALFGAILQNSQLPLQLPYWLLALAYALIGWSVGMRFTLSLLRMAMRALPQIALSIVILMLLCAGIAWMLTQTLGVDFLTAYLATTPGGLDTVAIIATSYPVDMAFVITIQTLRLFTMVYAGPALARFISRYQRH